MKTDGAVLHDPFAPITDAADKSETMVDSAVVEMEYGQLFSIDELE